MSEIIVGMEIVTIHATFVRVRVSLLCLQVRSRIFCGGGTLCEACVLYYEICDNEESNKEHCIECHDDNHYDLECCYTCLALFCILIVGIRNAAKIGRTIVQVASTGC